MRDSIVDPDIGVSESIPMIFLAERFSNRKSTRACNQSTLQSSVLRALLESHSSTRPRGPIREASERMLKVLLEHIQIEPPLHSLSNVAVYYGHDQIEELNPTPAPYTSKPSRQYICGGDIHDLARRCTTEPGPEREAKARMKTN